jgi:hypothetical protein
MRHRSKGRLERLTNLAVPRASLGENSNVPGAELKIPDRELTLGEDVDHVSQER